MGKIEDSFGKTVAKAFTLNAAAAAGMVWGFMGAMWAAGLFKEELETPEVAEDEETTREHNIAE